MKMKCVRVVVCLIMLFATVKGYSQNPATKLKSIVDPLGLTIGVNKTTNLIFPYAIVSIDRGSKDLLVQKAKGVENILQIKAANELLRETNLTVVTDDGSLYSFIIRYTAQPTILNYNLGVADETSNRAGLLSANNDNEARIRSNADLIALKRATVKKLADDHYDIAMRLVGIYIQGDIIYYQLELENRTNLKYSVDQLKFSILDQKKSKRTSSQDVDVEAVYVSGNVKAIETQSKQVAVFAIPKFSIPNGKELLIQLFERNGGRNLSLKIKNKNIIGARPF